MKANELMIGDYVYVNGNVTQIMQINEDNEVWTHKDPFIPNENVEPIPLTEEILAMNGFKCRKTYACPRYSYIDDKGHKLISFLRDTNGYEMQVGGHRVRLHYVHELQRVLRCCGLFDLADNFKVTADGVTTHTSEQKITD